MGGRVKADTEVKRFDEVGMKSKGEERVER